MALYSGGGLTYPDVFIGLISLLLTITSITLNALVFLYNYRKQVRSVPRFLFLVLSGIDLATGVVVGNFITIQVLRTDTPALCDIQEDMDCIEEREMGLKLYGCVDFFLSQTPGFVAATMSICRYRQIKKPFRRIRLKLVEWSIVCFCLGVLSILVCFMTIKPDYFYFSYYTFTPWYDQEAFGLREQLADSYRRLVALLYLVVTWPTFLSQLVSLGASSLTVKHLMLSSRLQKQKSYQRGSNPKILASVQADKKSSIKIILTNTGGIIQTLYLFGLCERLTSLTPTSPEALISGFIAGILPVFLSVLNPVIFIVFTPKLKHTLPRYFKDSYRKSIINGTLSTLQRDSGV